MKLKYIILLPSIVLSVLLLEVFALLFLLGSTTFNKLEVQPTSADEVSRQIQLFANRIDGFFLGEISLEDFESQKQQSKSEIKSKHYLNQNVLLKPLDAKPNKIFSAVELGKNHHQIVTVQLIPDYFESAVIQYPICQHLHGELL